MTHALEKKTRNWKYFGEQPDVEFNDFEIAIINTLKEQMEAMIKQQRKVQRQCCLKQKKSTKIKNQMEILVEMYNNWIPERGWRVISVFGNREKDLSSIFLSSS